MILGQIKVEENSNEITAIPQPLRALELSECIVTIDAMGTQKEIAREIKEADAHYVLALKGNHEKFHEEVSTFLLDAKERGFADVTHKFLETVEKNHRRIETRRYWITEKIDWFVDRDLWEGLRSFGMIENLRQIDGVTTSETRFLLTSIPAEAKNFARASRGQWSVKNCLHWSLDVCPAFSRGVLAGRAIFGQHAAFKTWQTNHEAGEHGTRLLAWSCWALPFCCPLR